MHFRPTKLYSKYTFPKKKVGTLSEADTSSLKIGRKIQKERDRLPTTSEN